MTVHSLRPAPIMPNNNQQPKDDQDIKERLVRMEVHVDLLLEKVDRQGVQLAQMLEQYRARESQARGVLWIVGGLAALIGWSWDWIVAHFKW